MSTQTIMAIIDPTCDESPAFDRALSTAKSVGGKLHLYTCINEECSDCTQNEAMARHEERLEYMARSAESNGVSVTTEIDWNSDWQNQVVKAANKIKATLVLKDCQLHSEVDRQMRETSDWTLLRQSPCPVLMIKNFSDWGHKKVLGAVNTLSTDSAHTQLNEKVIAMVKLFSESYGSEPHLVNAYTDKNHEPNAQQLSDISGAPLENIHVVEADASKAISKTAVGIDADLIVIGSVGRSGIKGRVIGNTSEKILDQTHSDVMVLN